jgi:hypothetical protein
LTKLRILSFDLENRPATYWYEDKTTAQITAIASCWVGKPSTMRCSLLTLDAHSEDTLYDSFLERYEKADVVTGHYIIRHDLPLISGHLLEKGLAPLGPKLVSDTRAHLKKRKDMPASQEALAEFLGLKHQKYLMTQARWREANRLTPGGLWYTRRRVIADVRGQMEMYEKLVELGWLSRPKMWFP